MKKLLSKHEDDLFNIANNFSIRHHRENQKDDYDDAWLTWLFYVNLSTVHLVLGRVHGVIPFEHEAPRADGAGKLVLCPWRGGYSLGTESDVLRCLERVTVARKSCRARGSRKPASGIGKLSPGRRPHTAAGR